MIKIAVINPPGWLQNAGATHTSEEQRNWQGVLLAGKTGATSLVSRGGVHPGLGNALTVTQTGSPSMAVIVKSGTATISGTEGSKQGVYSVLNDADVTLSIAAAHATLNRIDIVCFKVEDQAYSGSVNSSSLVVVTGTPAASPTAPAAPNNSITLAQVAVAAAVSSIVNANITDTRPFMAGVGGTISVSGATEEGTLTTYETLALYRRDTDIVKIYDGSGFREYHPIYRASQTLGGSAASVSFTSIPTNLKRLRLRYTTRCDVAAQNFQSISIRINNDSGANYNYQTTQGSGAAVTSGNGSGGTSAFIGLIPAASAGANQFGTGLIDIVGWDSPHSIYLGWMFTTILTGTAFAGNQGGGHYIVAGPYNRVDIIPQAGNFIAGSAFYLEGDYT